MSRWDYFFVVIIGGLFTVAVVLMFQLVKQDQIRREYLRSARTRQEIEIACEPYLTRREWNVPYKCKLNYY